jgi:hypothetical protein
MCFVHHVLLHHQTRQNTTSWYMDKVVSQAQTFWWFKHFTCSRLPTDGMSTKWTSIHCALHYWRLTWEECGLFSRDGVPAHTAIILRTFLNKNGVAVLCFPQYFHDMVSWDFFYFQSWKSSWLVANLTWLLTFKGIKECDGRRWVFQGNIYMNTLLMSVNWYYHFM